LKRLQEALAMKKKELHVIKDQELDDEQKRQKDLADNAKVAAEERWRVSDQEKDDRVMGSDVGTG
jgi:hypothetical protein